MKRLLVGLTTLSVILVLSSDAFAQTVYSVTPNCDTPAGRDTCDRWYTDSMVSLSWSHEPGGGGPVSGCDSPTFTNETVPVWRQCKWSWTTQTGEVTITQRVWIGIDRMPPEVLGLQPDRAPDFNGWFNHPVQLTFQGRDATSGISSCTSTTYSGPDAVGVPIAGSCRDAAGHVTLGAFPINYDATPPPFPNVSARPGNRRVALKWESSQYLVRVARVRRARSQVIYEGAAEHFTDRGLRNGRRYRYVVTLIDQAGNTSSDAASAVPTRSPLLLPADGAHLTSAPELVWKRKKHASYYNVQMRFRGLKVLT